MGTGSRGLRGLDPGGNRILRAGRVARAEGLRIMSAAAWMDTHSVAEINRENGYRVRFPASGSQTDEQQSLASRYQARPALANTSEEDMKRDISLTATYHREGDPATEQPRATIHVGRDDISISMDLGLISIDIEDWPAVQAEIESLLAVRGHFLEGEAA